MRKMQFDHCFVCGPYNPTGLHMNIEEGDQCASGSWIVTEAFVGYDNILHGGVMASIMDDMMAHATYSMNVDVVTAHLEMDYRAPVHVGDEIFCEAHVTERGKGKSIRLEGTIRRGDTLAAEAKSVMVIVK